LTTAIDTNVLLDLLIPNAPLANATEVVLYQSAISSSLVISEAVYAELAGNFLKEDDLNEFLRKFEIDVLPSSREALYLAGHAWSRYTQDRPSGLICSQCGTRNQVRCGRCEAAVTSRQQVLSEFLVGGHALLHADRLMTRDRRGYYRTYFPDLELV
jgi:predicted nucleic acid-binding protein